MATPCPYSVQLIDRNEYIGDSLDKINNNFTALELAACDLEKYIEQADKKVRTFFYYGPNSTNNPTENMQDNLSTRPNNSTIQTFVNSSSQLNLLPTSKKNDQVYVIYQKTGWTSVTTPYPRGGSGFIPYRVISRNGNWPYSWSAPAASTNDINYRYSPNFIIYRLTHDGTDYKVDSGSGFPRFVRAQSANTINWNNPKSWITY
jgi:hypothetical protein